MLLAVPHLPAAGGLAGLFRTVMIDLAPPGDTAVAVGLSAAGLRRRSVVVDLGHVGAYNATLPASLAITPDPVVAQFAGRT